MEIRNTYPGVSTKKDLPLDDEKHQDLKEVELWDEHHPIIFHIHNNPKMYEQCEPTEVDIAFNTLMRSDRNKLISLKLNYKVNTSQKYIR